MQGITANQQSHVSRRGKITPPTRVAETALPKGGKLSPPIDFHTQDSRLLVQGSSNRHHCDSVNLSVITSSRDPNTSQSHTARIRPKRVKPSESTPKGSSHQNQTPKGQAVRIRPLKGQAVSSRIGPTRSQAARIRPRRVKPSESAPRGLSVLPFPKENSSPPTA